MTFGLRPFGLISTSIWQSRKFCGLSNLDTRLAYLWLHTSAKTCAGVLRLGPAHLGEEVDFIGSHERAAEVFQELVLAGLIHWLRPYVIITNFIHHNPIKSYRHAIGAFGEALALPDCAEKSALIGALQRQKGAMDLANWRDKVGQPHEILHQIHAFLSEEDEQTASDLNPSETLGEGFASPSGIRIQKQTMENVELKTPLNDQNAPHRPTSAKIEGSEIAERKKRAEGPVVETIVAAKRMELIS